ncbi:hypothetical protein N7454_001233 [Penicillium verhagenii]|nr:hypothetical protein N7454_001233 [Penicillium verhagenii]
MAPITKTLALAGALFAFSGFAAPIEKRAVVWETVTDVVWTTVDVTTTLYPQELIATATATVVPVTTSAAVETTAVKAAKTEEIVQPTTSSTSTSSSTTVAAAPVTTEQAATTAAPAVVAAAVEPATTSSSSTSTYVAPVVERTTSSEATTTTSAAPAATTSASTTSSDGYSGTCDEGSPCTGDLTYYDTATSSSNPSSCGTTNDGLTELVLALPVGVMVDSDCGKSVTITYNGVTKTGTVVDKCMGCDDGSVDLSRAFFEAFDSLSAGRISGATWYIN